MAITDRSYANHAFGLNVNGKHCGIVASHEGGNCKAEVITIANSGQYWDRKQLGSISYEPLKAQLGGVMAGPAFDLIEQMLANNHQYFQSSINAYDFNMKTKAIKESTDCLMTEVQFPACDGAAKDAAYISITWMPQMVKILKGDDSTLPADWSATQKTLRAENYALTIDKVGKEACKRTRKIEPIKISTKADTDKIGEARIQELILTNGVDYGNLEFTISEVNMEKFAEWHQAFVIDGHCSEADETTAELVYKTQSLDKDLIQLTFENVGIFNLAPSKYENHASGVREAKVSCYCERIKVKFLTS